MKIVSYLIKDSLRSPSDDRRALVVEEVHIQQDPIGG